MNISSKNIFARYYRWINGELPNDLCSFFWGSLFNTLFAIFLTPGRLLTKSGIWIAKLFIGIMTWIIYILVTALGQGIIGEFGYQFYGVGLFTLAPLLGAASVALSLGVVVGVVAGIIYLMESDKPKAIQNSVDTIAAIKGKYCTKITWKD